MIEYTGGMNDLLFYSSTLSDGLINKSKKRVLPLVDMNKTYKAYFIYTQNNDKISFIPIKTKMRITDSK